MKRLLFPLLLFIAAASCKRKAEILADASGFPGEVLVVVNEVDQDSIWNIIHDRVLIDSLLIHPEATNNQTAESEMILAKASHKSYNENKKLSPLILVVETANDCGEYSEDLKDIDVFEDKGTFKIYHDVWARPQTVIRAITKPRNWEAIQKAMREIIADFRSAELRAGLIGELKPNRYSDSMAKQLKANYGFSLDLPPQFRLAMANKELIWFTNETQNYYRHLFINIFSDSVKINTMKQAIENRNLFTKKYIHNQENTKVEVSKSGIYPKFWESVHLETFGDTKVLRGWYTEVGTFRRGPFERWFLHDKARHRYVVIDGFLHAPNSHLLLLFRPFELIARSVKL